MSWGPQKTIEDHDQLLVLLPDSPPHPLRLVLSEAQGNHIDGCVGAAVEIQPEGRLGLADQVGFPRQ